ncbi:MAG: chaperonin GroEL [Lachnospiraceae bacterium]
MSRLFLYEEEAREKFLFGINQFSDAIKATLGPKGRNVLIPSAGGSGKDIITNDGATIAGSIDFSDRFENMGVQLVKTASARVNAQGGDGTTTCTVLSQFMLQKGIQNLAAGANPIEMRKGMKGAVQLCTAELKKAAKPVKSHGEIAQVASISAQDNQIGEMVAQAFDQLGPNGIISVEESMDMETTMTVKTGMQFDNGFINANFLSNPASQKEELVNPYILVTDKVLSNARDLLPLLENIRAAGRPLLIIAENIEGDVLPFLVINKQKKILNTIAVKAPTFGDDHQAVLEDIATVTGAKVISDVYGYQTLREVTIDMLGSAASVKVEKESTMITEGGGDKEEIRIRTENLRTLIQMAEEDTDKMKLGMRLSRMANGAAVIRAGGVTETEMKERRLRVDDACSAARAAMKDGIVPGGGTAYLTIYPAIEKYVNSLTGDQKTGAAIVLEALKLPAAQIAANAGMDGTVVVNKIMESPEGFGYDAENDVYCDMIENGIMDPARISILALRAAVSVAATVLTTEAAVAYTVLPFEEVDY